MFKYLTIAILLTGSFFAQSQTVTKNCHGCTEFQMKRQAESHRPTSFRDYVYVFNSTNELVKLYEVSKVIIDDFIEHVQVIEKPISPELDGYYQEYLIVRQEFLNEFDSPTISSYAQRFSTSNTDSCTKHKLLPKKGVRNSSINAFSFIRSSQERSHVFNEMMQDSEMETKVLSAMNHVKEAINSNTPLNFTDLNVILTFHDKTSIETYIEPLQGGLVYKVSSGLDADCNLIPETKIEMESFFKFTNLENLKAMENHLWYKNTKWVNDFQDSQFKSAGCSVKTRCRWEGTDNLVCYGYLECK
jgi:hypothetical protein